MSHSGTSGGRTGRCEAVTPVRYERAMAEPKPKPFTLEDLDRAIAEGMAKDKAKAAKRRP